MEYYVHKQLIPKNNFIWVLQLDSNDTIDVFETLEQAQSKIGELISKEENINRAYKVCIKNEDGSYTDI